MTTPASIGDPYAELANALRRRVAVIADRELYQRDPSGHLQELRNVSEQIQVLQSLLPPPIDPQFAHYLQRCSYDKALAFIEAQYPAK